MAVTTALVVFAGWGLAYAQRFGGFGRSSLPVATPESFDGTFQYCRAAFRGIQGGDGGGWLTDYPLADQDLSIRVSELTRIPVSFDAGQQPNHLIVRLTDDTLFQCPFIMMQEVGTLFFSEEDAKRLRAYLLKGGFLWVDDFWGSYAWDIWAAQIKKVLPPSEYPMFDLQPDHPIYHTMFDLKKGVPQIPSINFWYGSRGGTSERGADSAQVHARAIANAKGEVMVLMTHNTDVSDSWEREGEDPNYFYAFSVDGYQVAINVLIYAMTH